MIVVNLKSVINYICDKYIIITDLYNHNLVIDRNTGRNYYIVPHCYIGDKYFIYRGRYERCQYILIDFRKKIYCVFKIYNDVIRDNCILHNNVLYLISDRFKFIEKGKLVINKI